MDLDRLSPELTHALALARRFAAESSHPETGTRHLLKAIVQSADGPTRRKLAGCGLDLSVFQQRLAGALNRYPAGGKGDGDQILAGDLFAVLEAAEARQTSYRSQGLEVGSVLDAMFSGAGDGLSVLAEVGATVPRPGALESPAAQVVASPAGFRDSSPWMWPEAARRLARRLNEEVISTVRRQLEAHDQESQEMSRSHATEKSETESWLTETDRKLESRLAEASSHLSKQQVSFPASARRSTSGVTRTAAGSSNAEPSSTLPALQRKDDWAVGLVADIKKIEKSASAAFPGNGCLGWFLIGLALLCGGLLAQVVPDGFGFISGVATALAIYGGAVAWLNSLPVGNLQKLLGELQAGIDEGREMIRAFRSAREARHEAARRALGERHRSDLQQLHAKFVPLLPQLHEDFRALPANRDFAALPFDRPDWTEWAPGNKPEFAARFGELHAATEEAQRTFADLNFNFSLPALDPFAGGSLLLFKATGETRPRAVEAVQAILTRLLSVIPPGKLRFTFFDPMGLGQSVTPIIPLGDDAPALITSRPWNEPEHIEKRLAEMTEHIETVIQKYLRTDYQNIHDYNVKADKVAEAFRFLVVFDFPVNFTDTAARRLVSIVQHGPRCGVYTVLVQNTGKPLPHGFTEGELERGAAILQPDAAGRWVWKDPDWSTWQLDLEKAAPKDLSDRIIKVVAPLAKAAMHVAVPFAELLAMSGLEKETWWDREKGDASNGLKVPLGPTAGRKPLFLQLGEGTAQHAVIIGRPGSGKSVLMHVIITALALKYAPREVQVYLIDFKGGVEFKPYATERLPHALAIAIQSEREFGLSVLERLGEELQKREDAYRGLGVNTLADYRKKAPADRVPRILLLVDEFQEFFTQDDVLSSQAKLLLDRLIRKGRAFGLHVLLGSQSLAGSFTLPKSTLDQMAVRIALQCSEADSRIIFADDNPAARLLSRPGEAIYNSSSGLLEGNELFQVAALVTEDDRLHYLDEVRTLASNPALPPEDRRVAHQFIFEGDAPASLETCQPLESSLADPDWSAPQRNTTLWLGEPIAIRPATSARLARQAGAHMLSIARDEAEGIGLCVAAALSLVSQHRPGEGLLYIVDLSTADAPWAGWARKLEQHLPMSVRVLGRRDSQVVLGTLAADLRSRIETPAPEAPPVAVMFAGIHRLRELRDDGDDFGSGDDAVLSPRRALELLLKDGPESGFHVIAWSDTLTSMERVASRSMLAEFGLRVAGPMSAEDSSALLDDSAAARLDKGRAIFHDEERPGVQEKFRPYALPSLEWIASAARRLAARGEAPAPVPLIVAPAHASSPISLVKK